MKPNSKILLALTLTIFFLAGVKAKAATGENEPSSRPHAIGQIAAVEIDGATIETKAPPRPGEMEVTQRDQKKLLAGIGYLYAGFLIVLFVCEMSIRKEKRQEPNLYLVKR